MVSLSRQRLVTAGLLVAAAGAIVLATTYQGERLPDGPNIVGNDRASVAANGGVPGGSTQTTTPQAVNPIEGFLPRSGEGSACREAVGVDLIDGFAATLTINGITIAAEEMNVVLNEDGEPTNEVTASRSLGHYTFGPEPACPNGSVIRATDNVMQACVYRLIEGPGTCVVSEISFDAL